jgi:hypothetical protein
MEFDTCPICKRDFRDCKHSILDVRNKQQDDHIRKIIREELKKQNART